MANCGSRILPNVSANPISSEPRIDAPEAAEAADHDDDQHQDDDAHVHARIDAEDRRRHHARDAGEIGADAEDQREHLGDVDAERLGGCAVVDAGAHQRAERVRSSAK